MIERRAPGWTFEVNLLGKLKAQVAWTFGDEGRLSGVEAQVGVPQRTDQRLSPRRLD